MKVGFIVECTLEGPDAKIYPYVAKQLCDALETEKPIALNNKKTLLQDAPVSAQTLLKKGCDKVFILWDRVPRWDDGGDCETDKAILTKESANLKVNMDNVYLGCIDDMLESWLIADGDGVTNWIKSKTTHKIRPFDDHKEGNQSSPKEKIDKYLREHFPKIKYNDHTHNFEILKKLKNYNKAIKWNASFGDFANAINKICPKL